jgi:hypothetical protein
MNIGQVTTSITTMMMMTIIMMTIIMMMTMKMNTTKVMMKTVTMITPIPMTVPKRKKNSKIPLAAPIRKGGRILSNISASLIRSLTALLILAVMIFASWTFLRASAPYGDIMEAVNTKTVPLSLAAYLSVALIFLLSEFIALLWSMTKVRVRDQWGVHKEDTGRGLNSFLLVFLTSYAAFWINRFLPETPDIIYGLKGGLEVYGSMHNVLFGLCAAGIISCLIRKYL